MTPTRTLLPRPKRLNTLTKSAVSLVQFTDQHLFGDPSRALRGVQTLPALQATLAAAAADISACDAVLATGDLVPFRRTLTVTQPFDQGDEWVGTNGKWVVDQHVDHGYQPHQHSVADNLEMKYWEVHAEKIATDLSPNNAA